MRAPWKAPLPHSVRLAGATHLRAQPQRPQSQCACNAHQHTGAHGSGVEGKRPMRTARYRRSDLASRLSEECGALLRIHAPHPQAPHLILSHYAPAS